MPEAQVNVPKIGKVKKPWLWGTMAVVGGYVGWRWYRTSADKASGDVEYTTDYVGETIATGGVGAAGGSGNVQYAGTTTDATSADVIDTNAEWTNKAVELLANAGYDPATVYGALGDYLANAPLTSSEQTIVRAALAAVGKPPVGGPYVIREQVGDSTLVAPTGLKVTATSPTSVNLAWSTQSGAREYYVYRGDTGTMTVSAAGGSVSVYGLQPNSTYTFRVAAVSTTGKVGPKSASVSAKTKGAALTAPSGVSVTAVTRSSAVVRWSGVSQAQYYRIQLNGADRLTADATTRSTTLTGLKPRTTYTVTVRADASGTGAGPVSKAVRFTTKK